MCEKIFWEKSPIPNWPKPEFLKKKNFSIYCTPINQAIIDWLNMNNEKKILEKFLSSNKNNITKSEMETIREVYSEQIEIILMKSWY